MKRKLFQKVIAMILSVTLLIGALSVTAFAAERKTLKPNGTASSLDEMQALIGTLNYDSYVRDYLDANVGKTLTSIVIDISKGYGNNEGELSGDLVPVKDSSLCYPEDWGFTEEEKNTAMYLPTADDNGAAAAATWSFDVPSGSEGLYNLYIEYFNCQNADTSVSAIQRKLLIDGKVPFSEVSSISFDKHWVYNNISEAVVSEADGKYSAPGTYVDYETTKEDKSDAYYKVVTVVYEEGGKLMQSVVRYKLTQDINGNSMSPEAVETSEWSTYICRDTSGYHDGYFSFYLPYGKHTITLEAEREPTIVKSITFVPVVSTETDDNSGELSYSDYIAKHSDKQRIDGEPVRIEAEFPDLVSDSSVIPSNSNDSAQNYPISAKAQIFNVIGETSYSAVGQWAAYKFTVNKSGLYKLGMRYKQSTLEGMFICRTIKLAGGEYGLSDGSATVPFTEAQNIRFDYDKEWQSDYIGDYVNGGKREFEFYFEEGIEYTMYIECSLGDLRDYIRQVESSLSRLNEAYLKIIQRTGSSPDQYQDYNFFGTMPEVVVALGEEALNLTRIADELEALCGTNGSHLATLDTVARILDLMGRDKGDKIAENMSNLKTHLGTLGTWVNDSKVGTLIVDSIYVAPVETEEELPRAKANFFKSLWFEISSFIYSFFTEYDQMGLIEKPDENTATVDVWLASGRDQSQIWRTMIDSDSGYTKNSGNAVALKLVTAGTLLPSILAGRGPDVYLGLGSADVINYAIRDAVLGISGNSEHLEDEGRKDGVNYNAIFSHNIYANASGQTKMYSNEDVVNGVMNTEGYTKLVSASFDGTVTDLTKLTIDEYKNNLTAAGDAKDAHYFAPAAMNTLELLDVTYGIPLTMSFAMMFYRMDVLAELKKEVPETWDQLLAILPDLQTNNMTIGVSYVSALDFMMYQQGGNMWKYTNPLYGDPIYDPKYTGSKIDLDSNIALKAFDFVCSLYTENSLPVTYDASNRFRTGEMPIVIGDYIGTYNTLVVFATEIGGLWEFCSLPGSVNPYEEDGFNYDSLAGVTATIIPNGCDDYQAAWEFVQWSSGTYAQATYGNKIVALIGPAAKYETANVHAIEDLSWTAAEKAAIRDQMANLNAIVNYPGSYIIARYMKFAFLDAYNAGANPYEALLSYVPAINDEIARKRDEFDLPVAEDVEDALIANQTSK